MRAPHAGSPRWNVQAPSRSWLRANALPRRRQDPRTVVPMVDQPLHILPRRCRQLAPLGQYCLEDRRTRRVLRIRCAQFTATSIIASRRRAPASRLPSTTTLPRQKSTQCCFHCPSTRYNLESPTFLPKIRSADPIPCPSTPARHAARIHCRRDRSANRSLAPPESVSNGRWVNLPAFPTGFPHTSTICCRRDRSTNHSLLQSGLPSSVPRADLSREQLARHRSTTRCPDDHATSRILVLSTPGPSVRQANPLRAQVIRARHTPTIHFSSRMFNQSHPRAINATTVIPAEDHLLASNSCQTPTIRCRRGRSTSHSLSPSTPPSTAQQANPPFVQAMLARHTSTIRYLHACSTNRTLAPSMPRQSFQREDHLLASNSCQTNAHDSLSSRPFNQSQPLAINAAVDCPAGNPPFVQAMLARHTSTIRYLHDRSASHSLSPSVRRPPVPRANPSACEQCPPDERPRFVVFVGVLVQPRDAAAEQIGQRHRLRRRSNASCQTCAQGDSVCGNAQTRRFDNDCSGKHFASLRSRQT